jgi:wobble nucleotide-excising tRNase
MIKKIISIKNTGKFRSFTFRGDLQFKKLNLIYAENGRGKTTLSQILRSIKEQNESIVRGRRTVDGSGEQSIDILFDTGNVTFRNGKWNNKPTWEIEIFDSVFVSESVFSGHILEHDHKRQLYLFTIFCYFYVQQLRTRN